MNRKSPIRTVNRRDFISTGVGLAASMSMAPVLQANPSQDEAGNGPQSFEFAIIGAGLFGSAAARHLSKLSDSVALIGPGEPSDRKNHQGVFASHYDTSRLIRVVDPDLVWATLAKRSIDRYDDIERRSGLDFKHDIGYMMVTPGGLGADWFNLPAMREVASDLGVGIEDLDDATLNERFPYLDFTPGSSAVYQEQDAGYLNPRMLIQAQQALASEQRTRLIREEVLQLKKRGQQIEIGLRSGGTLHANRVLVATGAYTNSSKLLHQPLDMKIRAAMIMASEVAPDAGIRYPATLYAKTDGAEDFWGLLMPPITYVNGRTYVKTMDGYYGPEPLNGFDELGAWSRSNGHQDHHHVLRRALQEVFPSLEVLSTQFQPCLIADTNSHYPYVDMVDDRIGIVVGGNGKGAKSSDEIGRIGAQMIAADNWSSSLPQAVFAAQFS